jgi:hypothetical protein
VGELRVRVLAIREGYEGAQRNARQGEREEEGERLSGA